MVELPTSSLSLHSDVASFHGKNPSFSSHLSHSAQPMVQLNRVRPSSTLPFNKPHVSFFSFFRNFALRFEKASFCIPESIILILFQPRKMQWTPLRLTWLYWIGDRSYSVYLLHWPLLVFYRFRQLRDEEDVMQLRGKFLKFASFAFQWLLDEEKWIIHDYNYVYSI